MMLRAAFAAALVTLIATPALAQPSRSPNILGQWVIEAPLEMEDACVIVGRAHVTAGRGADNYSVRLNAVQRCDSGAEYTSEQQCAAQRENEKLVVHCAIVSASTDTYVPDDFLLFIRGRDAMDGRLLSAANGDAVWRRPSPARIS